MSQGQGLELIEAMLEFGQVSQHGARWSHWCWQVGSSHLKPIQCPPIPSNLHLPKDAMSDCQPGVPQSQLPCALTGHPFSIQKPRPEFSPCSPQGLGFFLSCSETCLSHLLRSNNRLLYPLLPLSLWQNFLSSVRPQAPLCPEQQVRGHVQAFTAILPHTSHLAQHQFFYPSQ